MATLVPVQSAQPKARLVPVGEPADPPVESWKAVPPEDVRGPTGVPGGTQPVQPPAGPVPPEDVRGPTGVPGGTQPVQPPAGPVLGPFDYFERGTASVGRGLADVAGAPVDLTTLGLNAAMGIVDMLGVDNPPYIRKPFMGSDWIADMANSAYESLGGSITPDEQVAPIIRVINDATRFGTGALVGGSGMAAAARTPGRSGVVEALSKPYEQNAPRTIVGDTAAGAGSGAGVGLYEEAVPEDKRSPLGTLIASLIGGTGAATGKSIAEGIGGATVSAGKSVAGRNYDPAVGADPLTGVRPSAKEVDQAAARAQAAASNPTVAQLNIGDALSELDRIAPRGAQPTTGPLSNDVGLNILENAQRSRNPEPFINRDRYVSTQARSLLDESAPPGASGRDLTDFAGQQRAERVAAVDREAEAARKTATSREVPKPPIEDYRGQGPEASRRIDSAYRTQLDAETRRKNELYNDPELLNAPVDPSPIYEAARKLEASLSDLSDPESIPNEIIGRIRQLAEDYNDNGDPTALKPMTYGDVQDLRAQVSDEINKALVASGRGESGSGPRVRNLRELRGTLDDYIEQLAAGESKGLRAAAVRVDGEVYSGRTHEQAVAAAQEATGRYIHRSDTEQGFIGSDGKFLSRDDNLAALDALGADQIKDPVLRSIVENEVRSGAPSSLIADALDFGKGENTVAEKARAALTNYRENFAPRFREGQSGAFAQDIRGDRYGTRTRPEDTADRFLGRNKGSDVESLDRAVGMSDSPEIAKDARTYLLDKLAARNPVDGKTGLAKPEVLRRWYESNAETIKRVPGMADEVQSIIRQAIDGKRISGEIADELKGIDTRAAEGRRAVDESAVGRMAGKSPDNAVKAVFNSDDPERMMKSLAADVANDEKARNGLKAAVRDYLVDTSTNTALQKTTDGSRPVSFAKLENFFNDNAGALAEVYSPEEMNALRSAHKLLKPLGNLALRGTSGSDTTEKSRQLWRALEAGLKARYGVLKGGGILRTVRVAIDALPNSKGGVDRLVERMMFDPELAMHLLSKDVQDSVNTPEWNGKLNRLLGYAAAGRESGND